MLFVFMLATFIGLGVITRVSRLLHTPLMSLTNAISAIAVVGAIAVAGGGASVLHQPARRDRPVRLDDQHRQRLFDHRPDAEDVQAAGAEAAVREFLAQCARNRADLPRRGGAVHPVAVLDEQPADGPPRRAGRRVRR